MLTDFGRDVINIVDLLSGLIGLAITAKVWWDVREIQAAYQRRARLPELLKQLAKVRSNIAPLLKEVGTREHDLRLEFATLQGHLRSIKAVVPSGTRKAIDALDSRVKLFGKGEGKSPSKEDEARDIHIDLAALGSELEGMRADDQWRTQ